MLTVGDRPPVCICAIAHLVWQSPVRLHRCAVQVMLHSRGHSSRKPQRPTKQQFLTPGLTTTYSPGQLFASYGKLKATLRAWRSTSHLSRI